jgi:hypothetical protein
MASVTDSIVKILQNTHKMMNERTWINDDIFEHLPTLYKYAKECNSIIECGVRNCVSSYPLIKGLLENSSTDKKMVSIDLNKSEGMKNFESLAKTLINFSFFEGSDLQYNIQGMYDMVFIDTLHVRAQLERELKKYAPHCNKYIIMHDTTVDEYIGECIRNGWDYTKISAENGFGIKETMEGLWPAITDFIADNSQWIIKERYKNNNGLTILERVVESETPKIVESIKASIEKPAEERIKKLGEEIKNVPQILKYSEIKNDSIKNANKIIEVMADNECKDICIMILGGLHTVFTEITSTLQRQIIDLGVLCKISKDSTELGNIETLYLLFNAHQHSAPIPSHLKYAVFNYEQAGSTYMKYPEYIQKMQGGVCVFDYSYFNKSMVESATGKEVHIVPFSYHPSLSILEPNTSNNECIDVLFYGVMNPNRQLYADILKNTAYNVEFATDYNLFGDALYEKLKNTKIVLNLHYYTNPSVLELSRIVPLISNHKLVLSEPSNDQIADARFSEMVVFITPENIISEIQKYLENPQLRFQKVKDAFKILSEEI